MTAVRRLLLGTLALLLGLAVLPGSSVDAGAASATTSSAASPLAGPWGRYLVKTDDVYGPYLKASGTNRTLLGKIALRSRVRWFGEWIPTNQVADKITHYISVSQAGNKDKLVQLAIFRLWPNGGEAGRSRPLTNADQLAYRAWIRAAAAAIGTSRVAVVLEPDLPVALKGWNPAVREALTKYAAQVLSRLSRTTVYVDAGDADWLPVSQATSMLKASGVAYARGFSLGATHYSSATGNIAYARQLSAALAKAGVPGKHAVLDTADNGKAFTWTQYYAKHPKGDFDNAETCRTTTETRCDTLGHPPTWNTGPASDVVDAYLWFGRPWLVRQASPFSLTRALALARTTPY